MKKDLISVYKSVAPPFPTAVMAGSYNISLKDSIGVDAFYDELFCYLKNGQSEWYFSESTMREIALKVIDKIAQEPAVVLKAQRNFEDYAKKLLSILDKEKLKKELPDLANDKISELFEKATNLYQKTTYWPEPAYFCLETLGQEMIRQDFKKYLRSQKNNINEARFSEIFATLSNPTKRSFTAEAELSLLRIALLESKEKERAIKSHANKYYWQIYDYYGPILDEKKIKLELKDFEKLSQDTIKGRIRKIENFNIEAEQKLQEAISCVPLDQKFSNIFQALRVFSYFYGDVKKEIVSKASVGLGLIIKEIAKRFGVDESDLHYATVAELKTVSEGDNLDIKKLQKRRKRSCLKVVDTVYTFLSDEELKKFEQLINKKERKAKLVKGMSASSGLYIGKACLISNVSQIETFQKGEILVTKMTTVDFVPAMKKAGAIVTDLGGITCHAAIVSRELGIPCIIATRNATQIIKTGDKLEVNARHGIIKIL